MVAHFLDPETTHHLEALTFVGTCCADSLGVQHIALLREVTTVNAHEREVEICHMNPPLQLGEGTPHDWHDGRRDFRRTVVDVHGYLDDLSTDEAEKMRHWLENVSTMTPVWDGSPSGLLAQYVACPHMAPFYDNVTGTLSHYRFSCVGFVIECYRACTNVVLIDCASKAFPTVGLKEIRSIWGELTTWLKRYPKALLGSEVEPWPVVLPGYVFHALQRPANQIRTRPYLPASFAESAFP